MKTKLIYLFIAVSLFACKEDDPVEPHDDHDHEGEVITTLKYILTPQGGGATKEFTFTDLDGDGANAPVITIDTLDANTMYIGALEFLNEAENPTDSITAEVLEEGAEHQVFFQKAAGDYVIDYTDMDKDGNPIGLATTFMSNTTGGALTITLRHEPSKGAAGVSDGDITNAGGETDIEVIFDVNVR